jgi:membrane protein
LRAVLRIAQGLWLHEAPLAASAMAFNFFLSLIPLLVVLGYIVGHVVRRRGVEPLLGPLLEAAPDMANALVRKELERLAGASSSSLAPLGVGGFLWLASSGTHGLMDVFELALGAPRRPWWKKRVFAVGWVVGFVMVVCFAAWVLVRWDNVFHVPERPTPVAVASATAGAAPSATSPSIRPSVAGESTRGAPGPKRRAIRIFREPWEQGLVGSLVLGLALAGLAAFYRYSVEHPPGIRRRAWPGAFVALVAFMLVSYGFGAYVASLGKYALFYGSLAAVAILLVWLWLASIALLLGAEVNAQLEGVRDA